MALSCLDPLLSQTIFLFRLHARAKEQSKGCLSRVQTHVQWLSSDVGIQELCCCCGHQPSPLQGQAAAELSWLHQQLKTTLQSSTTSSAGQRTGLQLWSHPCCSIPGAASLRVGWALLRRLLKRTC